MLKKICEGLKFGKSSIVEWNFGAKVIFTILQVISTIVKIYDYLLNMQRIIVRR